MSDTGRAAVDIVREALRDHAAPGAWRQTYRDAVANAYRQSDAGTVSELTALAAAYLAGEGRVEDAVAEVEFAVRLSEKHPQSQAHLLRVRSSHELLTRDPRSAISTLGEARRLHPATAPERDRLDQAVREAIARCVCLEPIELQELASTHAAAESVGWLAAGLKAWVPRWLYAMGHIRESKPWVEQLRIQADVLKSRWRRQDAVAYERQGRALQGDVLDPAPPELQPGAPNYLASWSTASLDLHQALLREDRAGAIEALARIEGLPGTLPPALQGLQPGFDAVVTTRLDGGAAGPLQPPTVLSLLNLGAALAAGEAVGVGGSQQEAAYWHRWMRESVPSYVFTSGDWPSSVGRVRGLLAARAGDLRSSVSDLRAAVRLSDSAGHVVEAAVARVQLAELLAVAPRSVSRREWSRLRDEGREQCRRFEVPHAFHAHIASSAAALGQFDNLQPHLTPREIEVLGRLAAGRSYAEVAEDLGLSWRTVQTHAYRSYQKLGVSSRIAAISEARELGLL